MKDMANGRNTARLRLAIDCLRRGNLSAADILCRNILDGEPENSAAWSTLGAVAAQLQQFDKSAEYLEKASPGSRPFGAAASMSTATPSGRARYLLIKSWGGGFWSDVSHVLGGLLLAEITGRIPVVHWGENSLFGGMAERDAFTLFFEPVSQTSLRDLTALGDAPRFPAKWRGTALTTENHAKHDGPDSRLGGICFLGRTETIAVADYFLSIAEIAPWIPGHSPLAGLAPADLYRTLIRKYLRPVQAIRADVDAFVASRLAGAPFVATHLRGTDKAHETGAWSDALNLVFKALDTVEPNTRIYVMTDDQEIAATTVSRYGNRVVMTDSQRGGSTAGVHLTESADRQRLGYEVVRDVYIALQAAGFVGIGLSNPSAMIALIKDWAPNSCQLIGRSLLLRRSALAYLLRQTAELSLPDA